MPPERTRSSPATAPAHPKAPGSISSVQKACRILSVMSDRRKTRLTQIASAAGLDKATTLRLLNLLASEGFVSRDAETKSYSYGRELFTLSVALQDRTDLRALARPSLARLADAFGDTTILSVPSAAESVCVDVQFGKFPIRANYLDIGSRRPLGVGAGSLAILAALPDNEIQALLPRIAKRLDKYPRITTKLLEKHIALGRELGYWTLLDVVVDRMGGIAAPILGMNGRPVGALSIAALTDRVSSREEALGRALKREAAVVSTLCRKGTENHAAGRSRAIARES